jgi:DNA-binding protein H-NS
MKGFMVFVVIAVCFCLLAENDRKAKLGIYKQCLIEYNYSELDKRIKTVSKASKQRLEARKVDVQAICKNKESEYFSI